MTSTDTIKPTNLQAIDLLHQRAAQLHSMLRVAHGESGEALRCNSDVIQDAYFWSCADLAEQIQELARSL